MLSQNKEAPIIKKPEYRDSDPLIKPEYQGYSNFTPK